MAVTAVALAVAEVLQRSAGMAVGIRAIDYVVYHVPDMRKAKAFYRKTLGLAPRGEYTGSWAEFGTEPTTL